MSSSHYSPFELHVIAILADATVESLQLLWLILSSRFLCDSPKLENRWPSPKATGFSRSNPFGPLIVESRCVWLTVSLFSI